MRQPEVTRLLALALALLLAAPALRAGASLLVAAGFLADFLGDGRPGVLARLTPAPRRARLALPGVAADRYTAPSIRRGTPLVLAHGFTPEGKDDPRVVRAAALLARTGFEVAVPTLPELTRGRLRPADVEPVVAAVAAATRGPERQATVVGVSVGAGPALLAAADPRVRDRVGMVVCLGGYASARELLRFFLTGDFVFGDRRGHVDHDPDTTRAFVAANADLVDAATGQRLLAGDPAFAARFLERLPPDLAALLDRLSPERVVRDLPARLILVHGRDDPAVPYTESLRLAAARPRGTRVALVGALGHVETSPAAGARDLLALLGAVYAVVSAGA